MKGETVNIDELRSSLLNREYPDRVQIGPDQVVIDAQRFLHVAFIEIDKWKRDIEKCPAYVRLIKFKAAVNL